MKMRKALIFLLGAGVSLCAGASVKLLPGSIDFNAPTLWGKQVKTGLDDEGDYGKVNTHWYLDNEAADVGLILQKVGAISGYLKCQAPKGAVHRTLKAVSDTSGQPITAGGVYVDVETTLTASKNMDVKRTSDEDKIVAWIYAPDGSQPKFVLTAGSVAADGTVTPVNYVTDVPSGAFDVGSPVKVTMRAIYGVTLADGSAGVGFEVWLNGVKAAHDGGDTFFPSLRQSSADGPARRLRSVGFSGSTLVEKVNFTTVSPIDNPSYDVEDLSPLRESVVFTVDGYPSTSESLVNFPLLVRISEESITGFHYSRTRPDGSDIRFTDQNGKLLPCEVDTWNPDGESLVWVKVPFLKNGVKLTMHWAVKEGSAPPKNDVRELWSDYAAVWHFSEAAKGGCKDSTGNGHAAFVRGGKLEDAGSSAIGAAGYVNGADLLSSSHKDDLESAARFTFSGWYASKVAVNTNLLFAGTKGVGSVVSNVTELVARDGWGLYFEKSPSKTYWVTTGKSGYHATASVQSGWQFFGATFGINDDGETGMGQFYLDGAGFKSDFHRETDYRVTPSAADFLMAADGMCADELRVSKRVRSLEWMKAEEAQARATSFVSAGAASPKGDENYWVREPSITPNAWTPDETGNVVVDMGEPRFGFSMVAYYDATNGLHNTLPTETGSYKAIFSAGDGTVHGIITKAVYVSIYDSNGYRDVGGPARAMLFNSDLKPGSEVRLQGFWDVTDGGMEVWSHSSERWTGVGDYVQDGAMHVYSDPETAKKLWEFRHARIGNLFQGHEQKLVAGMNFLPWNDGYARRYDDSEMPADNQRYAGWLILQNVAGEDDPAAAYSPFYADGLGTVYFDAVNVYGDYTNAVQVQICRTAAPEGGSVTEGEWTAVPLTVLAVDDGYFNVDRSADGVTTAALAVTRAIGTTNCFYRVRAHIDEMGPVRFRIVRTDENWSVGGPDADGLVAIDNVIASAPALGISVEQLGEPADPEDRSFRGQKAPFDIAFPSAEDLGNIHPMARVTYITGGSGKAPDASYVGALTCRYRWRYLEQQVNEWRDLQLTASSDDPTLFVSADPIEGAGLGDIEYSFIGVVNAPYYNYVDYTGLDLHWPDAFTERRPDILINAEKDGVYGDGNLSPALGKDYFIRLREGRSAYEGYRLRIRRDDVNVPDTVIPMELADDGIWRAFYPTPTNIEAGVLWQIEGYNRQTTPGDYAHNRAFYCATDAHEFPYNGTLAEATADDFSRVPCDGVTGHLMVQIEEGTRGVTVIHADHQDFNSWTDANRSDGDANGHFVGTCSTNAPNMSGVSVKAKVFENDFKAFAETSATNQLWEEHFDLTPPAVVHEGDDKWAIENPFGTATTPKGWGAENGMWVAEAYRILGGKSMAFQMEGEGRGKLRFQVAAPVPRGIESFNYRARISQSSDIYSFNYYRGTNEYYALSDYTFVVPCAMKSRRDADFEGLGTLSAVACYDDGSGCYEARVERTSTNTYRVCIYNWSVSGANITAKRVAVSAAEGDYRATGLGGANADGNAGFAALFISCQYTNGAMQVQAGVKTQMINSPTATLSGSQYLCVSYSDESAAQHPCGTFGVGSQNCPAFFVSPRLYNRPVEFAQSGATPRTISFGSEKNYDPCIPDDDAYDQWTIRRGRLDVKDDKTYPEGVHGFIATVPTQNLIVEAAPHSSQDYTVIATNVVRSFGFVGYTNLLYQCADVDIRVSTGGRRGDGGCDVTVDDFVARQWRGEDFDDENNPDYLSGVFPNVGYGSPTNFVYTTAWKDPYHRIEFGPMRTTLAHPISIRAPLMDGGSNRGKGLGSFSFRYWNADPHARLIVQIATNNVDTTGLADLTKRYDGWEDVKTITFEEMTASELAGGVISCYVGVHGVTGVMRVLLDPGLVAEAQDPAFNPTRDPAYGRIYITAASARDNPSLDTGCWWGWNIRTTDDGLMQLLKDGTRNDPATYGMSFALNNSVTDDIRVDEADLYPEHKPFLQTPVFLKPVVGEVSFKARKYSVNDPATTVAIYGTTALGTVTADSEFTYLGEVVVDSPRYETYSFQTPPNVNYTCFRLAVTGVDGVRGDGTGDGAGPMPASGDVERVLIDELSVFEAIRARIGFRNVGAFRSHLADNEWVPHVPSTSEQPLCNEAWGVQTELYVAQLSDTVDYARTPKVIFHWYEGNYPWGYEKWVDLPEAKTAELLPADGTNMIYRASYVAASEAVVMPSSDPGTVVQYSLDVIYYMKDSDVPITNRLSAADWVKPSWYEPIDYNAQYGGNLSFAAYNILDTVAPKWSWINEINLFGTYDQNFYNSDSDYQYVEIAVPSEADITGWSVRMLLSDTSSNAVRTNTVAVFGVDDLEGTKRDLIGMASGMVFRVLASAPTKASGRVKKSDGTLDGVWSFDNPDLMTFMADGRISELNPFGIQLVRGSGIVEHEIVVMGTNFWAGSILEEFNPTNTANYFNSHMRGAHFFYAGDDDHGEPYSFSVWDSRGEASNFWDRAMIHTPGRINTYPDGTPQNIDPDHPTPYGTSILVTCIVGDENIVQTVGDVVESPASQIVVIQKGSERGTNITYRLRDWYDLGTVLTNSAEHVERRQLDPHTWEVTVGVGASNNITVVAYSTVCKQLRDLGIDENNKYTPAVMDWFAQGVDMYGNKWPDSNGNIYLCDFMGLDRKVITNLTLTQMYCLDICPTITNQALVGGMIKAPEPIVTSLSAMGLASVNDDYEDEWSVTNRRMRAFMMISNRTDSVTYPPYSPYVIRGIDPGSSSWDFATNSVSYAWTNVTFKVAGILANGLTSKKNPNNWIPLRWFVFVPDSFYQPTDPEVVADPARLFTTDIDVMDPFLPGTPGYEAWGDWIEKHPGEKLPDVFYHFEINERQRFYEIEIMHKNNWYTDEED